ncbi:Fe-S cluster assembly protein SufD [Bauldia litoralis]|uniref:Fe-S cluster assembly protein SufD n=2 Tax=Bauldia litoralis TaxID=665467 RepID=UPI003264CDFC
MNAPQRPMRTEAEQALLDAWENARPGLPGGSLIAARRAAAIALFSDRGLPHRRVEEWKYTDLRAGMRKAYPPADRPDAEAAARAASALADPLDGVDRFRLVMVDGYFFDDLSDRGPLLEAGIEVAPLAELLAADGDMAAGLLATSDVADGDVAVALNTAFATDGVVVFVPKGAALGKPIELVHVTSEGAPRASTARSRIVVGEGASVRFIESHRGPAGAAYQVNTLADIDIARGALVSWSRLQTESDAAQHLTTFVARMADDTSLDHLSVNRGAALARWQGFVRIEGRHARAGFYGATMLSDKEHGDNTLVVRHVAPDSVSNELFKNVVDDRATGAFQGMIAVEKQAQKTDAKMMTRALLLSDEAQFASKPELEIFADDVRCGHGATAGDIDHTQLFYLMSRGLPRLEAERLLIESFLDEAIDAGSDGAVAEALKGIVSGWLSRRGGA